MGRSLNIKISVWFLLYITGIGYASASTVPPDSAIRDTVRLRPGEFIIFRDSSLYATSDTLLILPAGSKYVTTESQDQDSQAMFDSLSKWASKKPWLNNLLSLFVVPQRKDASELNDDKIGSENTFLSYKGKRVRNIRTSKIDAIGPSVNDTIHKVLTGIENFINATHVITRDRVIINNMLIKPGDLINPLVLADNERIIRALPYIEDVRIIPIPVSEDEIDLLVVTKDVYSLGFGFDGGGRISAGRVAAYERNFLGWGHNLEASIYYDLEQSPSWGYGASYILENIRGTFIRAGVRYLNTFNNESSGIFLDRRFVTPDIKYSYGAVNNIIYKQDTTISYNPLRYYYQDYWLSRSIKLAGKNRNRLIFSGRFVNNHVFERPDISENEYHHLQKYELYLGSIAFSRENFYKLHQIYNFGKTEDIPYGTLWELTYGFENNEFFNSHYAGLQVSFGEILPKFGYVYFNIGAGGFFNREIFNRGIIQIRSNYFSPLIPMNRFQMRQFVFFDYTNGISRFADEKIYIGDGDLIRGLRSDSLVGTQRFNIKLESVVFSPFYLAGFRFVFYGFADIGFISASSDPIFAREMYSGIGIGVRIRNENLSFRTIQIRLGFYPILPPDVNPGWINISGEKYFRPRRFIFDKPDLIDFK